MIPTTNVNPDRYEPNSLDDRRLKGADSIAYLQLATAIEAIEQSDDLLTGAAFRALSPKVRRDIRLAEKALRRAAFGVVIYAEPR